MVNAAFVVPAAIVAAALVALPPSPRAPEPRAAEPSTRTEPVDFEKDVRPIVARCQPCHFAGGKMYDKLPFDKPQTIRDLGEKLFTRIKDPKDQDVIRRFVAQPAHAPAATTP